MARFYFHIYDDLDVPDDEGAEMVDLGAARTHAHRSARSLMCGTLAEDGRISLHHRIDIEDESGMVLASVCFADAVTIDKGGPTGPATSDFA